MEEKRIFASIIRHKGLFNLADLLDFMYDWCMDEQYKVMEKRYDEKIAGDTKSIDIKRDCDRKISDYFRGRIKLRIIVKDMKKMEVKREGEKVSINSGTIQIKFTALLMSDYQGKWENMPFKKFFRDFYDRYIIRARIEELEKKVEADMIEFMSQVKAFLELEIKRF